MFRPLLRMRTKLGIPFCGTKIKKFLGIPFELFSGKEHNSEFLSVQQKIETPLYALPPGPKGGGGGAHSPAAKGVGESQFQRLEKRLALCLLCDLY